MKETIKYTNIYGNVTPQEVKNTINETFSIGDRVACTSSMGGSITIGKIDRETAKSITIVDEKTGGSHRLLKSSIYSNLRRL